MTPTKPPTAREMVELVKAKGWTLEPGEYWDPARKCGCYMGLMAILMKPKLEERDKLSDNDVCLATGLATCEMAGGVDGFDGRRSQVKIIEFRELHKYEWYYREGRLLRQLVDPEAFAKSKKGEKP